MSNPGTNQSKICKNVTNQPKISANSEFIGKKLTQMASKNKIKSNESGIHINYNIINRNFLSEQKQ